MLPGASQCQIIYMQYNNPCVPKVHRWKGVKLTLLILFNTSLDKKLIFFSTEMPHLQLVKVFMQTFQANY